ncbi:MAG: N-acetylmuramoyl-L-alanine amidase [Proteobacteria bacterium]|nr:N-acetylmuramoyl-L-alanine amidase [Pseudomonadota bacterium]
MSHTLDVAPRKMRNERGFSVVGAAFFLAFCAFCAPLGAQETKPAGAAANAPQDLAVAVRAIHVVEDGEGAGLVLDLSREVTVRTEILNDPPRLVIDLPGAGFAAGIPLSGNKSIGPVSAWRAGMFMLGQSRLVLDLAQPAMIERTDFVRQNGTVRLVMPIRKVAQGRFDELAAADRKARLAARGADAGPVNPRAANAKPLIMLDPGHGGIDSGALGAKGEQEKDIVLATALAVKAALEADGRIEVAMTREGDTFVPLGERVRMARSRGAALFVSLHADSLRAERDVRGASIYTLADRASDSLAAQAAEKENRADEAAGVDAEDETREGVEDILFDLARRETRLFSHVVAQEAAGAFRKHNRLHKTPMRAAKFRVLKAPDVPSILIELGYLTNSEDIKILGDTPERAALAKDLAGQLADFLLTKRHAISAGAAATASP